MWSVQSDKIKKHKKKVNYTINKHRLKAKEIEDLIHTSIALGGVLSNHLKS